MTHDWHPTAIIGDPPQHRDYRHLADTYFPDVHPTARLGAFVTVDSGTWRRTTIGARTWLQHTVHVGHDCIIGDDCELSVGAVLCGSVELGNRVRVGVNASILPFRKIGDGARIGAGAVVTHDVPAGEVWAGVPARRLDPPVVKIPAISRALQAEHDALQADKAADRERVLSFRRLWPDVLYEEGIA